MAQTGVVVLTVNPFPKGQDDTQRRDVAYGTCAIQPVDNSNPIAITGFTVATDVITFNAVNTLAGTETITVSGFVSPYTYANGSYTLTSATGTTLVAALTHADAGPITAAAKAFETPEYVTGGLPVSFTNMVDGNFGKAPYQSTFGPLQTKPQYVTFFSTGGGQSSLPFYQYTYDTVNGTLRIASSSTELSNGATISSDTIGFKAEFIKNGF